MEKKSSIRTKVIVDMLLPLLTLLVFGTQANAQVKLPKSISFGTSQPVGGTFYVISAGMGVAIEQYTGMKTSVEMYSGLAEAAQLLTTKSFDLIMSNAFNNYIMYRGIVDFSKIGPQPVRILAMGHISRFVLMTRANSNINSFTDLKGKKVYPVTASYPVFRAGWEVLLKGYGMSEKDVIVLPCSTLNEAKAALIEGKVDAFLYPIGSWIREIDQAVGVKIISLDAEKIKKGRDLWPSHVPDIVKGEDYGLKGEYGCVAWRADLTMIADAQEELAYTIVKAVWENIAAWKDIHPYCREWTIKNATKGAGAPFHTGAIKYYKEKGLWGAEEENFQKQMLGK